MGTQAPPRCKLFPVFMGQEMAREGSSQRIHVYRRCGYGLVVVSTLGSLKPLLTCYGGLNSCQTVPRAELQAFLCFLQRTKGPATYICDAMAVSKGFRRLRQGQRCVSNTNRDLWSAIREASKQRDVQVHWEASARLVVSMPPRQGSLVLTRSQMSRDV